MYVHMYLYHVYVCVCMRESINVAPDESMTLDEYALGIAKLMEGFLLRFFGEIFLDGTIRELYFH